MSIHSVVGISGNFISGKYYIAGVGGSRGVDVAFTYAIDELYAVPFFTPVPISIDKIAVYVTGTKEAYMVLGIYENTSMSNLYPSSLLLSSSEIHVPASSAGLYEDTISGSLEAGKLYWFAFTATGTYVNAVRAISSESAWSPFGPKVGSTLTNLARFWSVSRAYDSTLPNSFTAGGAMEHGSSTTAIGVRIV